MAVKGVRETKANLRRVVRFVDIAVRAELDDVAADLRSRGRANAPQLEGDLIESLEIARRDGRGRFSRSVFSNSPYAVKRHEDFYNLGPVSSLKPPTSDGAVGRKYLSRPFQKQSPAYVRQVGQAVGFALRRALR